MTCRQLSGYRAQELSRTYPLPLLIGGREVGSHVAKSQCAEQGVANGVGHGIRVRVADRRAVGRNIHARQTQRSSLHQTVDVVAFSDSQHGADMLPYPCAFPPLDATNAALNSSEHPSQQPDFETVLAGLIDGLLVFSCDGRLAWVNQAAETLLGASRRSLLGLSAGDIFADSAWAARLVERVREGPEKSLRGEGLLAGDDEPITAVAGASVLLDRDGQPDGALLLIGDHTPRIRFRGDDAQRSRHDALNRLLASVAHELNNPLAGIRGAAQSVAAKVGRENRVATYADMIVRQADRMSELVRSLLLLEAAPVELQPTNIHRVLTEVLCLEETVAAERGVVLSHEFDPSLPDVLGNPARLEQLLLNLLKNAIEACPQHTGHVAVRTRIENSFYVSRNDRRVRYISIEVADDGPGLDSEALANVFTPFYSRTPGGHGLGLSIAQSIAAAHNGHIRADNTEHGGARFRVLLPVAEAHPA